MARLQCPSRTVLEPPEPDVHVELCVDWFAKRTEPWVGPLLIEPSTLSLFEGESTGPAPARSSVGTREQVNGEPPAEVSGLSAPSLPVPARGRRDNR